MENKIKNSFWFIGTEEDMKLASGYLQVIGGVETLKNRFDVFEETIMPKCLDVERRFCAEAAYKILFNKKIFEGKYLMHQARKDFAALPEKEKKEVTALALRYHYNVLETGYATKEHWSKATGYYYNHPQGIINIEFETAMVPDIELIQRMSKIFPSEGISYSYHLNQEVQWRYTIENSEIIFSYSD